MSYFKTNAFGWRKNFSPPEKPQEPAKSQADKSGRLYRIIQKLLPDALPSSNPKPQQPMDSQDISTTYSTQKGFEAQRRHKVEELEQKFRSEQCLEVDELSFLLRHKPNDREKLQDITFKCWSKRALKIKKKMLSGLP